MANKPYYSHGFTDYGSCRTFLSGLETLTIMDKENYIPPVIPHINVENGYGADRIITMLEESGLKANIDRVNWPEFPYKPLTTFSIAHTDKSLYIDFFVRCNYLRAMNYETNTPVHEDSSVAMAFQAPSRENSFVYLEFNCIGTKAGQYIEAGESTRQIDPSVLDKIVVSPSCGFKPFRELEGLFSWNILAEIPLSLFGLESVDFPVKGIRCNFYKCASGTQQPHFLSWQPVDTQKPDFKNQSSLREIVLE